MLSSARIPHIFAVLLLVLAASADTAAPPTQSTEVVAIADVHGDFDDFVAILQHAELIDKQNHWKGGKTTLVQLGDLLDRGPKPRDVMDLLMALQEEAPKAGGRVESLLGNHEVMNIMGDLRYVTPTNFASFADGKSEDRRRSAYKDYLKWRDAHSALLAEVSPPLELTESEWMARHPAGFIEHREAFGPNGVYGKWLRGHAAVAEIDGSVFLHGGISPSIAGMKVDAINSRIHDDIHAFDSDKQYFVEQRLFLPFFNLQEMAVVAQAEITAEVKSRVQSNPELRTRLSRFLQFPEWLSVRTDGPLWFRGYDQWTDEEGNAQVEKILQSLKADRLIVGHTVQKTGRIRERFGSKVFLIDTGMLSSYYVGGRASALQIQNGVKFRAEYTDQDVVLLEPQKSSLKTAGPERWSRMENTAWFARGFWPSSVMSGAAIHTKDGNRASH